MAEMSAPGLRLLWEREFARLEKGKVRVCERVLPLFQALDGQVPVPPPQRSGQGPTAAGREAAVSFEEALERGVLDVLTVVNAQVADAASSLGTVAVTVEVLGGHLETGTFVSQLGDLQERLRGPVSPTEVARVAGALGVLNVCSSIRSGEQHPGIGVDRGQVVKDVVDRVFSTLYQLCDRQLAESGL